MPTPSAKPDIQAAAVLRQFRIVLNAVKTHFQQVEKQVGIGGAQVWALSVVQNSPGLGVSALAQAMDIHQSTASNLVRTLVGKGLLHTEKDPHDRRAVRLLLSPDGQALLAQAPGPWTGVLPAALSRLDADHLQRLHQDLGQLILEMGQSADPASAHTPLAEI